MFLQRIKLNVSRYNVSVVSHKTDILMTYRGMSVGNVDSGEWFDDSTDQQIN